MKLILRILVGIAVVIGLLFALGASLPRTHSATVRTFIRVPAESLYTAIADVELGTTWRSGLKKVEVLDRDPLLWRETADWGEITFVRDEAVSPRRIVSRIADESQGFGGTWTYAIVASPAGEGSTLTITENGTVSNPFFRVMSKYVFGHYRSLETYARDIARRFRDTAEPERVH